MLRLELQPFYEDEVEKIRKKYGNFILINTNFNHVNAFFPAQNLFRPADNPGEAPQFGKAAVGMSREYAEGLRDHKQAIFEDNFAVAPEGEWQWLRQQRDGWWILDGALQIKALPVSGSAMGGSR